jgi:hypothetical protein
MAVLVIGAASASAAPAPGVEEEFVLDVSGASATLHATINPHESATSYHFEYGTSAAYGTSAPAPDGSAGSGSAGRAVSVHVDGLTPATVYHFRVVAESKEGSTPGTDATFTTQPPGESFELPDGRGWEMVSPPNKHGALIFGLGGHAIYDSGPIQAAANGEAITYRTSAPFEEAEGYSLDSPQMVSRRGPDGWSTEDVAPLIETGTDTPSQPLYQLFSSNLSEGLLNPFYNNFAEGNTQLLSAAASDPTPYIRQQAVCEQAVASPECFLPLFTAKQGYADVPLGTEFGTDPGSEIEFDGATPTLDHVLVRSTVQLTSTPISEAELYEWSAGKPASEAVQLVSVLPESEGGEPALGGQTAVGGGAKFTFAGPQAATVWNAIAAGGSRIFWESGSFHSSGLYMTDFSKAKPETIRLDVAQPGAPSGGTVEPEFQLANSSGSRVFFRDTRPLTEESGTSDLYVCEIVEEAGANKCELTDLTPEHGGEAAEVPTVPLGGDADGTYIYFAASGVEAPGATSGGSEGCYGRALRTTCNLYVSHLSAGKWTTTFVAALTREDDSDWSSGFPSTGVTEGIIELTARVSPDGRYLAFMSNSPLTGYDNDDALTGTPDQEVYLYDAQNAHLACVSCDPTGARPVAGGGGPLNLAAEVGGKSAANLPAGDPLSLASIYQPRLLFNDGRLLFNSADALVPQDVDGTEDVYEFELPGVGSCTTASASYSAGSDGCVSLISSGTSAAESGLLDASESGDDIFFLTEEGLTSQDVDTAYDVYDAHVCTAEVPCTSPLASSPACTTTEACREAPQQQPATFGAPPSATFAGAENMSPVKSKTKRKHPSAKQYKQALQHCSSRYSHNRHKRRRCKREARRKSSSASGSGNASSRDAQGARGHRRTGTTRRGQ